MCFAASVNTQYSFRLHVNSILTWTTHLPVVGRSAAASDAVYCMAISSELSGTKVAHVAQPKCNRGA